MEDPKPKSHVTGFIIFILMLLPTILFMVYHSILHAWCSRRQQFRLPRISCQLPPPEEELPSSPNNSFIQLITASKTTKEEVLIARGDEDSTCAVCLCEFRKGEEVRRLPECLHLFHLLCIDMWLYSHSSCPLCRTETNPLPPLQEGVPADS
ncbi:RING-H2 finger protein ATL52-like protein [Cinnamomum micranthum f. kanehirae]|uniref:RING-H2 finger protein ATL52-like protein n=1 Tax=Cinnamomum micranthum f. kanehirae TaxID=337451 RepID=A0A3S3NJ33_9MAGN|nr:RING-H2 finger protein ATL52-like protein [Cinnamomum micranthum f. kanehirae]